MILITGWALASLIILQIVVSTLDHLDAFRSKDALYGLDCFPALWLGVLVVVSVILFFLSRKRMPALSNDSLFEYLF
jgi:hypothetical protein